MSESQDATDAPLSKPRPRLILASASPRRSELLREAGYEFTVHPAGIDESAHPPNLSPAELARHLAFEKAKAVAEEFENDVVLAADTVVAFGDVILGKPADHADARRMLTLLSATTHIVITGIAVMAPGKPARTRVAMSAVRMRALSSDEVEQYVASEAWMGKAGGYGIQDQDPFVTRMSGSHSNIVGLPMEITKQLLSEAGIG